MPCGRGRWVGHCRFAADEVCAWSAIAAGPFDPRSALIASLLLPAVLATLVVVPSLLSLSVTITDSFPGGWPSGLALVAAILSAVPPVLSPSKECRSRCVGHGAASRQFGVGIAAWLLVGGIAGSISLGPLGPAARAMRSTGSVWAALVVSGATTIVLAVAWIVLAAERREPRSRATRRRHLDVVWRRPLPAGATALVWRRADVRRGAAASACFGVGGCRRRRRRRAPLLPDRSCSLRPRPCSARSWPLSRAGVGSFQGSGSGGAPRGGVERSRRRRGSLDSSVWRHPSPSSGQLPACGQGSTRKPWVL